MKKLCVLMKEYEDMKVSDLLSGKGKAGKMFHVFIAFKIVKTALTVAAVLFYGVSLF